MLSLALAAAVTVLTTGPYRVTEHHEILRPGVTRPDSQFAVDGLPFGKNRSTPPTVRATFTLSDRAGRVLRNDVTGKLGHGWRYRATDDGSKLAVLSGDGFKARLELFRVTNGRLKRVYSQRSGRARYIHDDHRFSPDGALLAYPLKERDETLSYKLVDTTTGRERLLVRTTGHSESGPPLWSPSGKLIGIFDGISNHVDVYDVASGRHVAQRRIVAEKDLGFKVTWARGQVAGIDDRGNVVAR